MPIPTLPPANRPNRDDPDVKDGVVPEKVKPALLADNVVAQAKVLAAVPSWVYPPDTVKAEDVVDVPIPTLLWTPKPLAGAAPPMNDEPTT